MSWSKRVLTAARQQGSLSQRELARRAGVPVSTVNRIETGRMSPTVEMLDRLLHAAGAKLTATLVPDVESVLAEPGLNESERRSLLLGVLTAQHLLADPVHALAMARRNLDTMRAAASRASRRHIDEWARLLEGPTTLVLDVLTGLDDHARTLRQATPFAGVVPAAERREMLRRLRAT